MYDALLAYLHFIALFTGFGLLLAELALLALPLQPGRWRALSRLDLGYGLAAAGILATGLARVFYGFKPALYYWHNPFFHALWITFLLIGLISIAPTLAFNRWNKAARAEPEFMPPPDRVRATRSYLIAEFLLFCIAPIFAVLMARGYGA